MRGDYMARNIIARGIDISKYQNDVDFKKVKESGIQFVIIRAGYGQGNIDGKFKRNADECTKYGIPFGVYYFSYAVNEAEAKKEAEYCLKAIAPYKLLYPVCFDLEGDSIKKAAARGYNINNRQTVSNLARAFLSTIESAGYYAMNYTNLDYYNRLFDDQIKTKYDMWAARYTTNPVDIALKGGLWQYTSKGVVPGISGYVDMDYAYKDYPSIIGGNTPKPQPTPTPQPTPQPTPSLTPSQSYMYKGVDYQYVFDPVYYGRNNPDVANALGTAPNKLFSHFTKFGMKEGRRANASFNINVYKSSNPDLRTAFGNDNPKYYEHYCLFGRNETRRCA